MKTENENANQTHPKLFKKKLKMKASYNCFCYGPVAGKFHIFFLLSHSFTSPPISVGMQVEIGRSFAVLFLLDQDPTDLLHILASHIISCGSKPKELS